MLRDYQKKVIDEVNQLLSEGWHNILVQSPTGSGKSIIMAELLREYLASGKRILLVAHKIELIRQLYDHVHRWLNFHCTIMADARQYRYDMHHQVCIASIQSWSVRYGKKPHTLPKADLVVIDEAHHCASNSYSTLFDHYADSIKIGFTATPRRLDNKGLRFLKKGVIGFQKLVKGVEVIELQEKGFLCEFKLYGAENPLDPKGKVATTAGDYNLKQLEEFVATELELDRVVDTWLQYAQGKKTVLYPTSVALSKAYVQRFNERGISAGHIDAKTPPNVRAEILEQFKRGELIVLGQHSIIIEGVDVPDIEAVQFIRPTQSLVIWFQSIGRALRPAPNKPHAIIIDHTTTHQSLPMPDVPQRWKLDPDEYDGVLPALNCPKCGHKWRPDNDTLSAFVVKHSHNVWIKTDGRTFYDVLNEPTEDGRFKPYLRQVGVILTFCPKCNNLDTLPYINDIKLSAGEKPPETEPESKQPHLKIIEIDGYECNPDILEELNYLITYATEKGYKQAWVGYKAMEIDNITFAEFLWLANKLGYKKSWASYRYRELLEQSA